MTSKTSAILFFFRDLFLGAAALAVMAGGFLLAGKIYVLFQPDPSAFLFQGTTPGTWSYLSAAAVQAMMWGLQCAIVVTVATLVVMVLAALGAEIRENWPRR